MLWGSPKGKNYMYVFLNDQEFQMLLELSRDIPLQNFITTLKLVDGLWQGEMPDGLFYISLLRIKRYYRQHYLAKRLQDIASLQDESWDTHMTHTARLMDMY